MKTDEPKPSAPDIQSVSPGPAKEQPDKTGPAAVSIKKAPSDKKKSPLLAAFLSLLLPGLGLIYTGLIVHGIVVFFTAILIVPYFYGIFYSYSTANKINRGEPYGVKLGLFISVLSGFLIIAAFGLLVMPSFLKAVNNHKADIEKLFANKPITIKKTVEHDSHTKTETITIAPVEKPAEEAKKEEPLPKPDGVFEGGGDVPMYPGTEILGISMRDNYIGHKFTVKEVLNRVVEFYNTNLPETGYKLISSDYRKGAAKTSLSFGKKGLKVKIDLAKSEHGNTAGLVSIIQ